MFQLRAFFKPLVLLLALAGLALYLYWGNTTIQVTQFTITSPELPAEFSGLRIVQISDLHNAQFGKDNQALLNKIAQNAPDLLVLTGDIIDSRHTDTDAAISFVQQAAQLAPTYYVTGNHESRIPDEYARLKAAMLEAGVTVLENQLVTLERDGACLDLLGLLDQEFAPVEESLVALAPQCEHYTILLSHRPDLIGLYAGADMDLVFSGHAHGGQFRFPFVGGLIAPHQGWFPIYDAGLYTVEDTQMIVSRGLGNSAFPFRLNNRPELIVAELKNGA